MEGQAALDKKYEDLQIRKERPWDYFAPTSKKLKTYYRRLGLDPVADAIAIEGARDIPGTDVPEPLFKAEPGGGRTRIATTEVMVDGMPMLRPMMDPTDTSKPLTLFEGTAAQARESVFGKDQPDWKFKSEYTGAKVGRRAGMALQQNNSKNKFAVDYIDKDSGLRVDNQLDVGSYTSKRNNQSQLYTSMNPVEAPDSVIGEPPSFERRKADARLVDQRIKAFIDQNPNATITEAVDALSSGPNKTIKGTVKYPPSKGKVLDTDYEPKDKVQYLEYDYDDRNKLDRVNTSKAPKGARLEDMKIQRELLEDLKGWDLKDSLRIHQNSLGQGAGEHRARVAMDIRFPDRIREVSVEDLAANPETKEVVQFLDYDTPTTKPQRRSTPPQRPVGNSKAQPPRGEGGFVRMPDAAPQPRVKVQNAARGVAGSLVAPEIIAAGMRGDAKGLARGAATAVAADTAIDVGGRVISKVAPEVVKKGGGAAMRMAGPALALSGIPDAVAAIATKGKSTSAVEVIDKAGNGQAWAAAGLGPVSPAMAGPQAGSMVNAPVNAKLKAEADAATKARQDALQRGGRWKIGGITLPEFGLSEVLGLNK